MTKQADYSSMTTDEFDNTLDDLLCKMSVVQITSIPGVREILMEELNNDVLDLWAENNPDKAYPEKE